MGERPIGGSSSSHGGFAGRELRSWGKVGGEEGSTMGLKKEEKKEDEKEIEEIPRNNMEDKRSYI